jgi:hypothetical protein
VPRRLSLKAVEAGEVIAFPVPVKAKNPMAVALGKLGGSKGGKARAANLTDEEKIAIARKGGLARQAMARLKKEAEARANASGRGGSS